MKNKIRLAPYWIRLLFTLMLVMATPQVNAQLAACIFDWAERSAPELISANTEPQSIQLGDFTVRYYDKTANALLSNNIEKKIFFYNLSSYLSGSEELAISPQQFEKKITFKVRQFFNSEDDNSSLIDLYVNDLLIESFTPAPNTDLKNLPAWSPWEDYQITFSSYYSGIEVYFTKRDPLGIGGGSLPEISDVRVDGELLTPRNSNLDQTFGTQSFLNAVGRGKTYYDELSNANPNFVEVGYEKYWSIVSGCNETNYQIPVLNNSYENKNRKETFQLSLPLAEYPYWMGRDSALADFFQNGEMTLLTTTTAPAAFGESEIVAGKIRFYSREQSIDSWVDVTDLLLVDDTGCTLSSKILVGDFNNDMKPDAFFLCTGTDKGQITGERSLGEKNRIILSQDNGKYINTPVNNGFPYTYSHGGTSFDFNGDGNLDVLATDLISGDWVNGEYILDNGRYGYPYLLLGDGMGDFTFDNSLSHLFSNCCIYSIEAFDFDDDGDLDIWYNNSDKGEEGTFILLNDNGIYSNENKIQLPIDSQFNNALDVVKVGNNLYTLYILFDETKNPYYWGTAIQKLNLTNMENELIYSHIGSWDSNLNCGNFFWLHYSENSLTPRYNCYGVEIATE